MSTTSAHLPNDRREEPLVLHAQWSEARLHLWGESAALFRARQGSPPTVRSTEATGTSSHPFAEPADSLARALGIIFPSEQAVSDIGFALAGPAAGSLTLRLPSGEDGPGLPAPSPHLAHAIGHAIDSFAEAVQAPTLVTVTVPTVSVSAAAAPALLEALEDLAAQTAMDAGHEQKPLPIAGESVRFFAASARFVRHLLAQQRFVPMLEQRASGEVGGLWQPWLGDDMTSARVARLLSALPPSARCVVDAFNHDSWTVLDDFLLQVGDAMCRRTLGREAMSDAIEGRNPAADAHVTWLTGLLGPDRTIDSRPGPRAELVKGVRRWIGALEERGSGAAWRLLLRISEPLDVAGLDDFSTPGDSVRWTLSLHLQAVLDPGVIVSAEDIWTLPAGAASVEGQRIEAPQELLLSELGRASRLYKKLEKVLEQAEPSTVDLSTSDAYKFLREFRPVLIEQGFSVQAPDWWDSPSVRLGARLQVQSDDIDLNSAARAGTAQSSSTQLGLSSLVSYRWQIAVGDTSLSLEQFEKLAAQHSPLIRLNGRWVEIRPEDVKAAVRFIRENPGGEMEVGRALRLAYASDLRETGVPILGMDATGWVATVFGEAGRSEKMPMIESPKGFIGTLRPYQLKGLSWLAFLDRLGLGSCLADDMGLGKTIQLLALLAHERRLIDEALASGGGGGADPATVQRPLPTLLVVPMSVVSNWVHEASRFTPDLKVLVHHGVTREMGDALVDAAHKADVVVTTYALAHRDRESIGKVSWARVVLDEAQNIKNPTAKQTRAIHAVPAPRRIALTGTPLENRLVELWSIMDFLNPGYLGSAGEFRRVFALPIERYRDRHRGTQLRGLVQPFVLRRLKSDPAVITDLPEKIENKEYCYLTPEQGTLYQNCVNDMLSAAERAEGMHRRGLVLAGLIKLKQICNHPSQFLKEYAETGTAADAPPINASRSGKCQRLLEMLQEVVAAGDKALVFTQFRQMGHLLATMLRKNLDREVLFLHGGTPAAQRQAIVAEFQGQKTARSNKREPGHPSGPPILLLSLKAGGVGLNLTAANHVFHFDRWWNPAVEAQATDRAYRIGQTRTVLVHKFVVSGTLEERIDQMIEQKVELASQIVGSGEQWLTELDTSQLRDLLTMRADAVGDALGDTSDLSDEVSLP